MTCCLTLIDFNDLPPVTYFKVFNLLKGMAPKSSPMDFIPLSGHSHITYARRGGVTWFLRFYVRVCVPGEGRSRVTSCPGLPGTIPEWGKCPASRPGPFRDNET